MEKRERVSQVNPEAYYSYHFQLCLLHLINRFEDRFVNKSIQQIVTALSQAVSHQNKLYKNELFNYLLRLEDVGYITFEEPEVTLDDSDPEFETQLKSLFPKIYAEESVSSVKSVTYLQTRLIDIDKQSLMTEINRLKFHKYETNWI